jgi:hypothetical protein
MRPPSRGLWCCKVSRSSRCICRTTRFKAHCDTANPRLGTPIGLAGRWVERAVGFVKIIERFWSLAPPASYLPLISNQIRGHREVLL